MPKFSYALFACLALRGLLTASADATRCRVRLQAPEDIGRFASLGVLPSVQPTHCTSDKGFAESRLGPERVLGAYVWQTFVDQGCVPVRALPPSCSR